MPNYSVPPVTVPDGSASAPSIRFRNATGATGLFRSGNAIGFSIKGTEVARWSSTGAVTITSAAAAALAVGPNGATNPVFQVDASTASAATGLKVTGAAAAAGVALAVVSSGTDESLTVNAKGAGTITFANSSTGVVQVGNVTNPALKVNGATAGTGISVTSAAAASGVALAAISSGGAENITIDAKGTGLAIIGSTSTGLVVLGRGSAKEPIRGGLVTAFAGTNQTMTAAILLGGMVNGTPTGAAAYTFDTGANLDAAVASVAAGDHFDVIVTNTSGGANTITLTAAAGTVIRGTATIAQNKTAHIRMVRIGASSWEAYVSGGA